MKNYKLLILLFSIAVTSNGQNIVPNISARVDTSKVSVKQVYHLYKNYLNSRPDSIYQNPNWNIKEAKYYLKNKMVVDRSAGKMFFYNNSIKFFANDIPKILQIDSIAANRYQIKTIFAAKCPDAEDEKFNPDYITKLYAVRDAAGQFKLENTISYDTRKWEKYQYKFINYVIHPDCDFNKKEASKAIAFCEKTAKQFNLKVEPFTYYILPNSDEMGKLYNFDYWMSYLGGQTLTSIREIFTTYGKESYPHEFVHMLFPASKDNVSGCPMIITEGIATWLAGPNSKETFEEALKGVSKTFQKQEKITLDDIMTFKIRNKFDNSILYVTGGVICKLVYEKQGKEGIWKLYNSNKENFNSVLEKQFGMSYREVETLVIKTIKEYNVK
ncbi:hypothetical protein [Flavobacterium sp. HJJ]|uniref:hypothetical protein n=1 Tax=Flavobacterium sp. HJJ TaxID=2783792 RepID=UPI00188B3EEB|nr:hypothetical protein [Flavobacterium sp. HJJ]MBF4470674.1 hypothetical protein [Flavobacterium sp. HJJ]